MSFTVHGTNQPVLVEQSPTYNPETRTTTYRYTFRGTELGINALALQFKSRGLGYEVTHDGPIYTITTSQPTISDDENVDRWEIYTESTEKSIFEHPDVVDSATSFDSALSDGDSTFKEQCEKAASEKVALIEADPIGDIVVRHLRSGVTGYQLDLVSLRRTRRIERYLADAGLRLTLDTGLLLYTTAQLNVPSDIAFGLPDTPADISTLFKWRWRKRSQRSEYVGQWVEHTVELTFAPWSTLLYTSSSTSLAW